MCPAGQYAATGAPACAACAPGYFCPTPASPSAYNATCGYGYACPAGSTNGTVAACAPGYFCPVGTGNATAAKCYAAAATATAWASNGTTSTLVAATPIGTALLAGTRTGVDVGCNDSPSRLPAAMTTPGSGAGVVTAVALADVTLDGVPDLVALLVNGSLLVAGNDGRDSFAGPGVVVATGVAAFTVLDVDADGAVDLVVYQSTGDGAVFGNTGAASLGGLFARRSSPSLPPLVGVARLAAFDVDGDGAVDIVAVTQGVRVLRRASDTSFVDQVCTPVVLEWPRLTTCPRCRRTPTLIQKPFHVCHEGVYSSLPCGCAIRGVVEWAVGEQWHRWHRRLCVHRFWRRRQRRRRGYVCKLWRACAAVDQRRRRVRR